jgi:serine/threonine protein kinase
MTDQQKCPPPEHLHALIAGTLAENEEAAVAGHLASCEGCQTRIEELAAPAKFKADVAQWLSDSNGHSDSLSKIIANAEADIRESARELATGQPTLSVSGNNLEDSVLSGDANRKRGYVDVEKWLGPDDEPSVIGRLGQFRLTEFIGRGGMGAVFKADDLKLQREVAVKILSPELATNKEACERFLREAQAIAAINHINIVTIHAVGEDAAIPYFVMEYVHGHSLQDHLDRRGQLKDSETTRIARHVAKGLAAAHARGIIHRDIKPANILIQKDSKRAKLTDFGLARAIGDGSLTSAGMLVGTPAYLPPEALEEKESDERSDLFSLGVTFYRAVTGKLPFDGPTPFATMQQVAKTEFTPLHELVPDVSTELHDTINALLQRDPDQRIQSADELVGRLKSATPEAAERSDQGLPVITTAEPLKIPGNLGAKLSPVDTRRLLIGVTSLVACSLAVYFGFIRASPQSEEPGTRLAKNDSAARRVELSEATTNPDSVDSESKPNKFADAETLLVAEVTRDKASGEVREDSASDLPDDGLREATRPMKKDGSAAAVSAATENSAAPTSVPEPTVIKPKPYALIAADNKTRAEFDSLRDAILAATPGSTVEIQESGRHTIRRPIALRNTPLTIAAREGELPTIVADLEDDDEPLISTESDLVLRGLIVIAEGEDLEVDSDRISAGALISVRKAMLKCSECRFIAREGASVAVLEDCPSATWIDCELYGPDSVAIHWQPSADGYLVIEQCVAFSRVFVSSPRFSDGASVILSANAIANDITFENRDEVVGQSTLTQDRSPRVKMSVERNLILSNESLINIEADEVVPILELARGFQWEGRHNTLPTVFLTQSANDENDDETSQLEVNGLSDWIRLPTVSDTGSITTEQLESLVTESRYDDLLEAPEEFSRIVGSLIHSRRLPIADSSIEQTLINAGPDK